jgi:pre-rRNA-processing protein TSR2
VWGGNQSRERALTLLKRVLDGLLGTATVHRDEVEDLLDMALLDDFNIEAEDNSPRDVAELLVRLHAEAKAGSTATADALLLRASGKGLTWVECPPPAKVHDDSSDDDDEGEEGEEGAATPRDGGRPSAMNAEDISDGAGSSKPTPVVDEDGFTTVPTRRRGGKR